MRLWMKLTQLAFTCAQMVKPQKNNHRLVEDHLPTISIISRVFLVPFPCICTYILHSFPSYLPKNCVCPEHLMLNHHVVIKQIEQNTFTCIYPSHFPIVLLMLCPEHDISMGELSFLQKGTRQNKYSFHLVINDYG